MKLLRWGRKGCEKPGLIDRDGTIRDLTGCIDDVGHVGNFVAVGLNYVDHARATNSPGLGSGQTRPRFLQPGDVLTLGVEGLGEQRQTVEACDAS